MKTLLLIILSVLASGCASETSLPLAPAQSQIVRAGIAFTLSVEGGQTDNSPIETVVEVGNRSRHTIYLFGYPSACAVPGNNPNVLVLDEHGRAINPATPTREICPVPRLFPLAPGARVHRTIAVNLKGRYLQATVLLAKGTGAEYRLETKPLHLHPIS